MENIKIAIFFAIALFCICEVSTMCNHGIRCANDSSSSTEQCCPYVNGTCCDDRLHCCPKDTECLSGKGICLPRTRHGVPDVWHAVSYVPLHPEVGPRRPLVRPELCPSKRTACPSKSTCCPLPYIGTDCCPLVRGVCCGDFLSCCPTNHSCDLEHRECVGPQGDRMPIYRKLRALGVHFIHTGRKVIVTRKHPEHFNRSVSVVTCRDSNAVTPTTCDAKHKCCPSGCCPIAGGTCCDDGNTCCPSGTTCDTNRRGCKGATESVTATNLLKSPSRSPTVPISPAVQKLVSSTRAPQASNIVCPGGNYTCPSHTTCCLTTTAGKYGCCPFPNANCCSDKLHCCPQGSSCNLAKDRCDRGGLFLPMFRKFHATEANKPMLETKVTTNTTAAVSESAVNQNCPDQSSCPDTYTCCQMPNTKYGCCPLTAAVCCTDHLHCCPHGTICDLVVGGCKQGGDIHLSPLTIGKTENVQDRHTHRSVKSECSVDLCDGGSCCKMNSGSFGCCSHKEGVCCGDGKHCCPKDNKCDQKTGLCVSKSTFAPFHSYL